MGTRHRRGLGAVVVLLLMASACGEAPAEPTSTPGGGTQFPTELRAACEITSVDGERLVPPPRLYDVLVGQTIRFTARVSAASSSTLAAPPYTYTWSSIGGGPTPLVTGRQTTNLTENAIQHVFSTTGFTQVDIDVTALGGNVRGVDICSIRVLPR